MSVKRHRTRRHERRGSALLEGIVALAILALGIAVIGGQMNAGMRSVTETRDLGRALMLTRSKLAELESGLIQPEEEIEGNFGKVYPGHAWRMEILPTQTPDLFQVRIDVLEGVLDAPMDSNNDDVDVQYAMVDENDPHIIYSAFTYRITPATVDLKRDFGFSDDQLAQLGGGGEDGVIPGFDLTGEFNPADLLDLPLEDLLQLIPLLAQALGGNLGGQLAGLGDLSRDELADALQGLGAEGEIPGGQGNGGENGDAGTGGQGNNGSSGDASNGDNSGGSREEMLQQMQDVLQKRDEEIRNGGGK